MYLKYVVYRLTSLYMTYLAIFVVRAYTYERKNFYRNVNSDIYTYVSKAYNTMNVICLQFITTIPSSMTFTLAPKSLSSNSSV